MFLLVEIHEFSKTRPQKGVPRALRGVTGSEQMLTSHCSATRGLLATDLVILNHGQVTRTTPELASPSPNYHTNGTFELSKDLTCIAPLHGGSLVVLGSNS
ncbi:hypothetical protein TNCV_3376771 [Trichonephila clavipes]|nr:hypothetical protein TNCV_3376771 [Trichonephila clavipes]